MNEIATGLHDIADALREVAAALLPPQPEEPKPYLCNNCGSPKWEAGGAGKLFKRCLDCGALGDKINE